MCLVQRGIVFQLSSPPVGGFEGFFPLVLPTARILEVDYKQFLAKIRLGAKPPTIFYIRRWNAFKWPLSANVFRVGFAVHFLATDLVEDPKSSPGVVWNNKVFGHQTRFLSPTGVSIRIPSSCKYIL